MPFLVWKEGTSTGIDELDDRIKGLISKINDIYELTMEGDDFLTFETIKDRASELKEMFESYYELEDKYMDDISRRFHLSSVDVQRIREMRKEILNKIEEFHSSIDKVMKEGGPIWGRQPVKTKLAPSFFSFIKSKVLAYLEILKKKV